MTMTTQLKRRALALLAGVALAAGISGLSAQSASAYSCVPYTGGTNLCTYWDGWIGARIFKVGVWHTLWYSVAATNQAPGNRTMYADMVGSCGCIISSQYAGGQAVAYIYPPTWAQPRSQMAYVDGGMLSQEIY